MTLKRDFGTFLRHELEKANLSMRKFSKLCGLNPATISRLVSGKQRPRPEHLSKMAQVLEIPTLQLWKAAGYEVFSDDPASFDTSPLDKEDTTETVADQKKPYSFPEIENLDVNHIMTELQKYRGYASTPEGKTIIATNFHQKVDQVSGIGPFLEKLNTMYGLYMDDNTEQGIKQLIGSALLYFILATDIIPDYMFPVGYLDDAIAIDIVWKELQSSSTVRH